MAPEDGATAAGRSTAGGDGGAWPINGQVLKKGPWSGAEDAILTEYVKIHGEGNWNSVQRNSGLMRCGKSCRLRWANHLRPNLKKGAFSPEEERQIIDLHSKLGNKWARMALHLEGRTDNEIKNYWNTRLKRRLRAGLPIYPVDFQQQQHHHRHQNQEQPFENQTSSSSNHANTAFNSNFPMLFNSFNYPVVNAPLYLHNSQSRFKLLRDNINGGVALSLPTHSNTQFSYSSPSSMVFYNHGFRPSNHEISQIPAMEICFENVEHEPPSIQSSFQAITPTCSSNTVNDHMIVPSNDGDNAISPFVCPGGNSGLLEDIFGESRALLSSKILSDECKSSETDKGKGKIEHDYALMEEPDNVNLESVFEPRDDYKTTRGDSNSSIDIREKLETDVADEINATDNDFSSWLDFSTGSLRYWHGGSEDASPINVLNEKIVGAEKQVEISCSPAATTETDHDLTMGSCCWNHMPEIS